MTPIQIYNQHAGNTHEAAVQAVWDAAFSAGITSAVVSNVTPEEAFPVIEDVEVPKGRRK